MTEKALSDQLILKSEKPARYTGGEFNTPNMDKPCSVRFCMCFPDVYEVAMSNLGIRILYHLLNDTKGIVSERCFSPWPDFAERLKDNGVPLFSLETRKPLSAFDSIGFSFQYELSYTNVLYMLELADIPLLACERRETDPVVMGGGPCMFNPEPMADFLDIIQIGDGEETLKDLLLLQGECKKSGLKRDDFLRKAALIAGVYVPKYPVAAVKRAVIKDLETAYFPTSILVPNIEVVHDRGVVELFRGCTRGCRFCQAGMIYRPVRERTPETAFRLAKEIVEKTGFEELSLSSLSTGDYSSLPKLLDKLYPYSREKHVELTLPSLRLDSFSGAYTEGGKKGSLTFAPEAGSQRLRNVINKNITEEDYARALEHAFDKGYSGVKLYFMMGLPTETEEDLRGIFEMVRLAKKIYVGKGKRGSLRATVSLATFVPKAFTPFQWEAQDTRETVLEKQKMLAALFRDRSAVFNYHDFETSFLEAVLARGDRSIGAVILKAYRLGARFDGWSEHFHPELWKRAFAECGVSAERFTGARNTEDSLPWEFIDAGVTRQYLLKERERAYCGETTPDCRLGCIGCGMSRMGDGICL